MELVLYEREYIILLIGEQKRFKRSTKWKNFIKLIKTVLYWHHLFIYLFYKLIGEQFIKCLGHYNLTFFSTSVNV